jgi:hypothetical protein
MSFHSGGDKVILTSSRRTMERDMAMNEPIAQSNLRMEPVVRKGGELWIPRRRSGRALNVPSSDFDIAYSILFLDNP